MPTATVLPTLAPEQRATPSEVERYRAIAEALMAQSQGGEPVEHWTQGVNQILQALMGGLNQRKANKLQREGEARGWEYLQNMPGLTGGGGYPAPSGGETADVPGAEPVSSAPTSDVEAYIRQSAAQRGIDPNVAVRVAKSEGLAPGVWQSRLPNPKGGGREPSYGPFQLYTGGGLGNVFQRQTGLDPRDPSTVRQQIDFALDQARQGGWTPWHGAKRVGISPWQGIGRGGGETADIPGAEPVGSEPAPDVAQFLGQQPPAPPPSAADRRAAIAQMLGAPAESPAAVAADVRKRYANDASGGGGQLTPDQRIAGAMQAARQPPPVTPIPRDSLPPQFGPVSGPPPGGAGTVPMPPAAAPPPPIAAPPVAPVAPVAAPVPRPRPAPPVAPAAPATTGSVPAAAPARPVPMPPVKNDYATVSGRRPSVAPVRPGQLMNEPYPGAMSAQEFARAGQAAMRAQKAGGAAPVAGAPVEPRRGLLQALLGRGGTPGVAAAPSAPPGAPVAPGRAGIAAALQDIAFLPPAAQGIALKRLFPEPGEGFTLGPDEIRYGAGGQELARGPAGAPEPYTLSPGQARFGPGGEQIAAVPDKPAEPPSGVREYEYARSQGFPGTFQDWEASKKGGMSLQVDPATGAVTFQQGGNIRPLTEAQSKDTVYATRAEGSLETLDKFGGALTSFGESAAGGLGRAGNYLKSEEYQQAEQAGREFLAAILRKDTGAAVTTQEMGIYGSTYLPEPGNGPKVLEQKRVSRRRALEALKAGMTPQAILQQENALRKTEVATETAPAATAEAGEARPRPASEAEYNALPSGTEYVAPDGSIQRKP